MVPPYSEHDMAAISARSKLFPDYAKLHPSYLRYIAKIYKRLPDESRDPEAKAEAS